MKKKLNVPQQFAPHPSISLPRENWKVSYVSNLLTTRGLQFCKNSGLLWWGWGGEQQFFLFLEENHLNGFVNYVEKLRMSAPRL